MRYRIEGGQPLDGEVAVQGSKNAALPILAATLLTDGDVTIRALPELRDVETLSAILTELGKRVERQPDGSHRIRAAKPLAPSAPQSLVRKMRASFLALGPLLARVGEAAVSLPGGDLIGMRPVDLHLRGLQAMGAEFELREGVVHATTKGLRPAEIHLAYPSVGATEHLMMTASLIDGRSVIRNPAREPEVEDLAGFLEALGAQVEIRPQRIEVTGRPALGEADYAIIPDRLCAGTYTIAAAITGGEVTVRCEPWHLRPLTATLEAMNVRIEAKPDRLTVRGRVRADLRATSVETNPYPGFPTDMHPPIMPMLALAAGESRLRETVFEDRFAYVSELNRMGAHIHVWGQTAIVRGVAALHGEEVWDRRDNRAGVALVMAGLAAEGTTIVHDEEENIPRGYSQLVETLQGLGAAIERA